MTDSTLRIGPASYVAGCGNYPSNWLAYSTTGQNVIEKDPRVVYVGALSPLAPAQQPQPTTTWIDATYHGRVVAGYPYGVTVAGPPGGFAMMLLGNRIPTPLSVGFGDLAFDPFTALLVDIVPLPTPWGTYQWNLPCPASAPVAYPFVFQALTLSPTGQLGVTVPSPLTVAWQHGVMPP